MVRAYIATLTRTRSSRTGSSPTLAEERRRLEAMVPDGGGSELSSSSRTRYVLIRWGSIP